MERQDSYTAFENTQQIAAGDRATVVRELKRRLGTAAHGDYLIFNDRTGMTLDVNFAGSLAEVLERLAGTAMSSKSPSASPAAAARAARMADDPRRPLQERVYRVATVLAGHLPGYEEAMRCLYQCDGERFAACIGDWPKDIRSYLMTIAVHLFSVYETTK